MAVVSLIFLIFAVVLGFVRKSNPGFIAMGLALILGLLGKIGTSTITGGFPTSLFVTLLGVMLLFSISQENKTLEWLARRVVSLAGKRTFLIPIIVYVFNTILAAIGPGTIPVMSLMAVFTCSLAAEMQISPVLLAAVNVLGAAGGGISPIAPTGILGLELASKANLPGIIPSTYFINSIIAQTVYFVVIYIVLGGYKMKSNVDVSTIKIERINKNQIYTLLGMAVMVVAVVFLKQNVGLVAFTVAMVLLILRAADEKKAIAGVPWATLILVCGVNMLMAMIIKLGGIKLLSDGLAKLMTPFTAPGILGLTAGIMSWFSSTSGVVMPTLIPTIPGIMENVGGLSALVLLSAVTNSAHVAGTSPLSTGGSLGLAAYAQVAKPTQEQQLKLFVQLFFVSAGGVLVVSVVALLGIYGLF
jgi:di/tricarboxylate transporter